MKFIMKVKIPNPYGNDLLKDPKFGLKMKQLLDNVNAEAAYFTTVDAARGGYVIVNMNDASEIPKIAEPFFFWLKADIEFIPVMTPDDLAKAAPSIETAARLYAS